MTNHKTLPIILDKLEHALNAQGVKLKRSQLLEVCAGAFGYRNSNELTAAAKSGKINPPSVEPLGAVTLQNGQRLVIMNDPLANSPYAVDESFLEQVTAEERREHIGITPYGHLVLMDAVLDSHEIAEIKSSEKDRYVAQYEDDKEPIYIIDNETKDEGGQNIAVSQILRTNDPLGDIIYAKRIAESLNAKTKKRK